MDIYEACPVLENDRFLLRQVREEDCTDLLKVYSDVDAVPLFNSDNCTGDFYITRMEDMERMIRFWLMEYGQRYYVRWSIIDRAADTAIGTIELFNRKAEDYFTDMGLLRLDLRSDYENADGIQSILSILLPHTEEMFGCKTVATKIPPCAHVRREALEKMGFAYSPEKVRGHDGRTYGDYYICTL